MTHPLKTQPNKQIKGLVKFETFNGELTPEEVSEINQVILTIDLHPRVETVSVPVHIFRALVDRVR